MPLCLGILAGIGTVVNFLIGRWAGKQLKGNEGSSAIFKNFTKKPPSIPKVQDLILGDKTTKIKSELAKAKNKDKDQSLTFLFIGPPGTGKTSAGTALGELVQEVYGKDTQSDVFVVDPAIYKENSQVADALGTLSPIERVRETVREANKLAKETGRKQIVVFDEASYDFFQGGETARSRSEAANRMTELCREINEESKNIIVVFACNLKDKEISKHLTDGGRRCIKVYFDYPDKNEKVNKVKNVLASKSQNIPADDVLLSACTPSGRLKRVSEELTRDYGYGQRRELEQSYNHEEKSLINSIINAYDSISFSGVELATNDAIAKKLAGDQKPIEKLIEEEILNQVINEIGQDQIKNIQKLMEKISKEGNYISLGDIAALVSSHIGIDIGSDLITALPSSNKVARILVEQKDKWSSTERPGLDVSYSNEWNFLTEILPAYKKLTKDEVDSAINSAKQKPGGATLENIDAVLFDLACKKASEKLDVNDIKLPGSFTTKFRNETFGESLTDGTIIGIAQANSKGGFTSTYPELKLKKALLGLSQHLSTRTADIFNRGEIKQRYGEYMDEVNAREIFNAYKKLKTRDIETVVKTALDKPTNGKSFEDVFEVELFNYVCSLVHTPNTDAGFEAFKTKFLTDDHAKLKDLLSQPTT